jgi:lysozyme family protein
MHRQWAVILRYLLMTGVATIGLMRTRFNMKENFEKSLELVLAHEGGYVHHALDPGGRTNLGVTQRVWEDYVGHKVDEQAMRKLTKEMVAPLYRKQYWDVCHCDDLPAGVDYLAFDFSVNAGAFRSIKTIQRALNITADGVIGPVTIKAIQDANAEDFITNFTNAKEVFYRGLANFPTFGRGWLNRVAESKRIAEEMIV